MQDRKFKKLILVTTCSLFSKSDEISIAPWTFIDKSLIVPIELKVNDHGMMKNQKDLKSGQLASQFVCLFVCCIFIHLMWEHPNDGNSETNLMFTRSWKMWLLIREGTIIFFVKTHEAILWALKVLIVYVGVVLIVDNVWIIKYVWLVKPLESILQRKFGTCVTPFCLCWSRYRICLESYVVCCNWEKLKKTNGVLWEWD
jgi:hypothetical protein